MADAVTFAYFHPLEENVRVLRDSVFKMTEKVVEVNYYYTLYQV